MIAIKGQLDEATTKARTGYKRLIEKKKEAEQAFHEAEREIKRLEAQQNAHSQVSSLEHKLTQGKEEETKAEAKADEAATDMQMVEKWKATDTRLVQLADTAKQIAEEKLNSTKAKKEEAEAKVKTLQEELDRAKAQKPRDSPQTISVSIKLQVIKRLQALQVLQNIHDEFGEFVQKSS